MVEQQSTWQGNLIFAVSMLIPLLGCVLAVYHQNMGWLVLLAPLMILMEGAFIIGGIAWFIVALLIDA